MDPSRRPLAALGEIRTEPGAASWSQVATRGGSVPEVRDRRAEPPETTRASLATGEFPRALLALLARYFLHFPPTTLKSTRRFRALPSSVSFGAMGRSSPYPADFIFFAGIPAFVRKVFTAFARAADSDLL